MPEVIADTSPLQYLHQTQHLLLLPALYGRVIVPEAVANEIAAGRSHGVDLPDPPQLTWIEVRAVERRFLLPAQADLGLGEREVLALVSRDPGALALLDDAQARRHAQAAGVAFRDLGSAPQGQAGRASPELGSGPRAAPGPGVLPRREHQKRHASTGGRMVALIRATPRGEFLRAIAEAIAIFRSLGARREYIAAIAQLDALAQHEEAAVAVLRQLVLECRGGVPRAER